jgi:hypothetical protein
MDTLADIRESLNELHELLRYAAREHRPLEEVIDPALSLVERARSALYAMREQQGR